MGGDQNSTATLPDLSDASNCAHSTTKINFPMVDPHRTANDVTLLMLMIRTLSDTTKATQWSASNKSPPDSENGHKDTSLTAKFNQADKWTAPTNGSQFWATNTSQNKNSNFIAYARNMSIWTILLNYSSLYYFLEICF